MSALLTLVKFSVSPESFSVNKKKSEFVEKNFKIIFKRKTEESHTIDLFERRVDHRGRWCGKPKKKRPKEKIGEYARREKNTRGNNTRENTFS